MMSESDILQACYYCTFNLCLAAASPASSSDAGIVAGGVVVALIIVALIIVLIAVIIGMLKKRKSTGLFDV